MERLNPDKLHVTYLTGASPEIIILPRYYTLTHSDRTGELFLSIGGKHDKQQISKLYTRLMRDEVLADLSDDGDRLLFRVYCHISGGLVFGTAKFRYNIFKSELPLVFEAIRFGDKTMFEEKPELGNVPIYVHFQSTDRRFDKIEQWGIIGDYL
jgi:hypothetical protein